MGFPYSYYFGYVLNICICAIYDTDISVLIPAEKQTSCKDRKTTITQNFMCACDFNMMLEESADGSKILLDAIANQNVGFPGPPGGKS